MSNLVTNTQNFEIILNQTGGSSTLYASKDPSGHTQMVVPEVPTQLEPLEPPKLLAK